MKKWIVAVFVVLLSAVLFFIWGINDHYLGDKYYYLPKYEAIDIGYPGGAIIYKSPKKNLFQYIKVRGNIKEVVFDKDFIIATRNEDTPYLGKAHSGVAKKKSLHYFIIVKRTDLVYGPYSENEYIRKREELGVPDKLELGTE